MAYPIGTLTTRTVVKKNNFAIIAEDSRVKNVVPGFENCEITILGSPKLGASFTDYIVKMNPNGKNEKGFGGDGVETFVYVIEGEVEAKADDEVFKLDKSGYLYCPPDKKMYLETKSEKPCRMFLYKQRFIPLENLKPWVVSGRGDDIEFRIYEGMKEVLIKDFLPTDMAFDMNMHILSFEPGACHPIIESHYQEHGAYILSGEGMYYLDDYWTPVRKEEYLYMSAYCPQAAYGIGREPFAYIYSKDCNRDPEV